MTLWRNKNSKQVNCYMGKRLGNNEFIEKAKQIHGDKYDYSKVIPFLFLPIMYFYLQLHHMDKQFLSWRNKLI